MESLDSYSIYWMIFIVFMVLSLIVSGTLNSRFKRYSKEPLRSGLTGKQIAEKMLQDNGIYDVKVVSTKGNLTDHYNPTNKTVYLSEGVYASNSVSAAAVAAHECGHAVQHATQYKWLKMRSTMVPVVQFGTNWSRWLLLLGLILLGITPYVGLWMLYIGVGLFALSTIFAFVTLPVEYNASSRALQWLDASGITYGQESEHAKDALKWAARTYVVAALSSLATLL
ncbi:zinc metallopeptidase, partial [Bacteroidales bacterium OttesenSCG-928-K22]|nr:zinc metallopeptidase [Bacteroidales bacterium OttesenSCG-928-K22]